jgi:hypothetical protein
MCHMLQGPTTLRNDVWDKGKTATSVTPMKMEYGDEMKLNLQDSIGLSLVTHQCHVCQHGWPYLDLNLSMIDQIAPWYMKSAFHGWSYNYRIHTCTSCSERSLDNTGCQLRGQWGVKILSVPTYISLDALYGTGTHKLGCKSQTFLRYL